MDMTMTSTLESRHEASLPVQRADRSRYTSDVDIVIPVYNEERDLAPSVRRLHTFLNDEFPFSYRITIADNASTDNTWHIARTLTETLPHVRAVRLEQKGRGRALNTTWLASDARVLAYMDVDLSTDLAALLPLVAPLLSGHSDIAIGSRLNRSSNVTRGAKRETISRCYNLILKTTLRTRFSDAQCGFKAIRSTAAHELLPLIQDTGWFFDTELLVLAERVGLRIHEIPVDWTDDPDSRVDILTTALTDLRGVARMLRALTTGTLPIPQLRARLGRGPHPAPIPGVPPGLARQLTRFAAIGTASTLAYLGLYLLLRGPATAQGANALALLATAIANTAANRRLTFGHRGTTHATRHHLEGLAVYTLGLTLTAGSLATLTTITPHPTHTLELTTLITANLTATLLRFILMRAWVFHPRRHRAADHTAGRIFSQPTSRDAATDLEGGR
jgi:putative flippase GtrA